MQRPKIPIVLAARAIVPRGDGYDPGQIMNLAKRGLTQPSGAGSRSASPTDSGVHDQQSERRRSEYQRCCATTSLRAVGSPCGNRGVCRTATRWVQRSRRSTGRRKLSRVLYDQLRSPDALGRGWQKAPLGRKVRGIRANASRARHRLGRDERAGCRRPQDLALHSRNLRRQAPAAERPGGCCGQSSTRRGERAGSCARHERR